MLPVQLLTTAQAAYRLNVSPATVRDMIARGEIPARRVGRQYRIEPEAIEPKEAKATQVNQSKRAREEMERALMLIGDKR